MRRTIPLSLSVLISLALLSCQQTETVNPAVNSNTAETATPTKTTAATDFERLSNRLVVDVANVKEGEIVFISGGARDLQLLENLATDVRKAGAFPLVTLSSDRIAQLYYQKVPEKYDSQSPDLDLKLATLPAVVFQLETNEVDGLFADVPPSRLAAVGKASEPVNSLYLKRNVRTVALGNDLYPTDWRASRLDMTKDELSRTFWSAVNTDYSALQAKGEEVRAALAAGKQVHITNPNGTDLKVGIEGRPFYVSDGIISTEDVKKGAPAVTVYLPAGEVYCAPVPGTAEGKVVVSRDFYQGQEITDLTLRFVAGKLVAMSGTGPGFAKLKGQYDASPDGKELFSFVDFGINPNFSIPVSSKLGNWIQSGMVTVGFGNNTWAGGNNTVSFGENAHLPGSTVTVDGRVVVENGVLKL